MGGHNLSKEFFKELFSICCDICFSVTVEVVGQAGYYDVTYEITENGWDILYCDFYEEDDENIWWSNISEQVSFSISEVSAILLNIFSEINFKNPFYLLMKYFSILE